MQTTATSLNSQFATPGKRISARSIIAIVTLGLMSLLVHTTSHAEVLTQGGWVNKQYKIKGGWEVVNKNNQTVIKFDSSFKTKSGPDLKIFLSKKNIGKVTGRTATQDAIMLSVLQSNSGAQEYVVPAGVNINDYQSLLIHCEAFSVLWGGGQL